MIYNTQYLKVRPVQIVFEQAYFITVDTRILERLVGCPLP